MKIIPTMGLNNCGSKCIIKVHVEDDKIVKIDTQRQSDVENGIPLTACIRGMNYHHTFINDQRLQYPLKRVGPRGSGEFQRISWEEAIQMIYDKWIYIKESYGVGSRYVNYATGVTGILRGNTLIRRLLCLDGGVLDYYNSYSTACVNYTTPFLYGTKYTGNSNDTLLDANVIILWGHNPMETKFGESLNYYLRKAKKKGIKIIGVDPRYNDTFQSLDAEWIPIRPSTDAALMDAMAYVIYTENLYDKDFIDEFCIGFDREHMPPNTDVTLSYFDYLMGTLDGVQKTPKWGEKITGIDANTIIDLARIYGKSERGALIPGYGVQRTAGGEQATRGAIMLACLTGNIGKSGGWAGGPGYLKTPVFPTYPDVDNPYQGKISSFTWTEAILRGTEMNAQDGVAGMDKLDSNIKMIFNLAGNILMNQHSDLGRTKEILSDTSKCEFIVTSDLFMTASAMHSDLVLPGTSMFENENITNPWINGDYFGFNNQVIQPIGESRFEFDWILELAEKLGYKDAFSMGCNTVDESLRYLYRRTREKNPELPTYEELKETGVYRYPEIKNHIAFWEQIHEGKPFATDSGKIEIFSKRIYESTYRSVVPPIPGYIPVKEGHEDDLIETYPLQLIGWHSKRRCHSIHDNNKKMTKLDPQQLWIHPDDARERNITSDDIVNVFNQRGKIETPVKLTERIRQGTVALSQGAWYQPNKEGVDVGGSINVLTSHHPTPLANGNPQHTNLVEVEKKS